ncbi:MAG: hypothetical protein DMD64_12250 [Gemmatimonadetes bacterium]|nr:MAG: hypothetical protein DMD64_12250 [Gemmatimonadota bacterium]
MKLLDIALVTLDARRIHPERLDVGSCEFGHLIAHGGELAVSAGGIVARIKHERDRALLQEIVERIRAVVRGGSLKRRGLAAYRERLTHCASLPVARGVARAVRARCRVPACPRAARATHRTRSRRASPIHH